MRKIVLIGKCNSITQNIYRSLMNSFYVQFIPEDCRQLADMYQIIRPELTLISLVDMDKEQEPIFTFFREKYRTVPVLCLGNSQEFSLFDAAISGQQFSKIVRPVTIREISEAICNILDIGTIGGDTSSSWEERRRRILLVDDSAIQLRVMRGLLQQDYDVDMATSGQEALKQIYRHTPDMIFLDYDMPDCDGKMTFEQFKNDPTCSDIPVVFLTGISERKKVLSVLNMYPADYLLKPVDQEKLMETIQNVLGTW